MDLNWLSISQNTPRGYNRLIGETGATQRLIIKAHTKEPLIYVSNDKFFHERDLYDFFDEQKLFISIQPAAEGFSHRIYDEFGEIIVDKVPSTVSSLPIDDENKEEPVKKKGGRFKKTDTGTSTGLYHETRRKAEQFAFEDAFALLEDK